MPHHSDRLESLLSKQRALRLITETMSRHVELDVAPIFQECLAHTASVLEAPMACLHLQDNDKRRLRLVAGHGLEPVWARAWSGLALEGATPPAQALAQGRVLEMAGPKAPGGLAGVVSAPVTGFEVSVGAMSLLWPLPESLPSDPDRSTFLHTVGSLLGMAIEHAGLVAEMVDNLNSIMELKEMEEARARELDEVNRQLTEANRRLEELSITDGLTGLFNHRHLQERLAEELARARRLGHPVCLLMADLDRFKRLNDKLGHLAGDEALRRFAGWLTQSVREVDLVGRYGGEEFLALLVNCNLEDGLKVANKIRRTVAQESKAEPFAALGGFTVSLGAAAWQPGQTTDQLIAAADEALYRAKEGGRNRVVAHEGSADAA